MVGREERTERVKIDKRRGQRKNEKKRRKKKCYNHTDQWKEEKT